MYLLPSKLTFVTTPISPDIAKYSTFHVSSLRYDMLELDSEKSRCKENDKSVFTTTCFLSLLINSMTSSDTKIARVLFLFSLMWLNGNEDSVRLSKNDEKMQIYEKLNKEIRYSTYQAAHSKMIYK